MADIDNMLVSEHLAVLGQLVPVSSSTTQNMAWTSLAGYGRFMAMIHVGAMVATSTVDAKLQIATSSGGAGAIDIPGKAITQMLAASDGSKIRFIDLKSDEIPSTAVYTHIRVVLTVATATSLVAAVLFGEAADYRPVTKPAYLTTFN